MNPRVASSFRYWLAAALRCAAILLIPVLSAGQGLVTTIIPPQEPLKAGGSAEVDVVTLNMSSEPVLHQASESLQALLSAGEETWPVTLIAQDPPLERSIEPGSFASTRYTIEVPPSITGSAILESRDAAHLARTALVIIARTNAEEQADATATAETSAWDSDGSEEAPSSFVRSFAGRISAHEPIYFIYGPDDPVAKFQFSFKYRLFDFHHSLAALADTLQFGYTQRSLWDLEGDSSPFYDTSYMPELIFEAFRPKPKESGWFTWLGYQFGVRHESNGRDGPISRSLNTVYIRPSFALGPLDGWHLLVMPELSTYLEDSEDNPDLDTYRGYGQLRLVLGKSNGPALMATALAGKDFDRGSIQLDLTLPLETRILDFKAYFLVQYFNGYGESLLSYNQKSETIRAGISFVR